MLIADQCPRSPLPRVWPDSQSTQRARSGAHLRLRGWYG